MKNHQKLLIQLNVNDVHMENFVIEKIQLIEKKLFILVIRIGIIKKMMKKIKNLNVHMEVIVIEKILIILMNIVIHNNDQKLNNEHQNVKVHSKNFYSKIQNELFL